MGETNMFLQFMIMCLFPLPFIIALGTLRGSNSSSMNNIAKPGCPAKCGDVSVPYPFGMGKDINCSLNDMFYLTCNASSDSDKTPQLFIRSGSNLRIHSISESEVRIFNNVSYKCYHQDGNVSDSSNWDVNFKGHFTFSQKNKFTVIGCDDYGLITGKEEDDFSSGCIGWCNKASDVPDGQCSGQGCCQTPISKGLDYFDVTLGTFGNHTVNKCGYAFLSEEGSFEFHGIRDLSNTSEFLQRVQSTVPVVLDWVIAPNRTCAEATECKENSECYDVEGGGYRCICNKGYQGNAYLEPGCQDINECKDPGTYPCNGDCINAPGSYNCTCLSGYVGDAKTEHGCQLAAKEIKPPWTVIIIAMTVGVLAILLGIQVIIFGMRKRKLMRLREKFFEQNGGVLLKQKLISQGSHEAMALFSADQLREATNNYSTDKIVGRGAYGVVYKGVLTDKRVVAIKKSKVVDGSQSEQFIHEVLILTQVIHRNVVKLLGCCLEEEVPVLVYEFISNNTFFHHLHHKVGGMSWLSWENRLKVAAEAAGALAYLHSETIMPIIHRDVKSTNILIDDNYTAKISDFGASRLVPLDHEQVTTLIQGTLGYLDPQYFNTSKLTEKSDVYSFGVVLAELLTGKKPIGVDRINEEKNLATYFVNSVEENRLFEIVEPRLLREGTLEKLQAVADLIKRCLKYKGSDRPTMKEVAAELEGMMRKLPHPWLQQQRCTESLVLEVDQSDLYDVPLIPYATNEWETNSSGTTDLAFDVNKPR